MLYPYLFAGEMLVLPKTNRFRPDRAAALTAALAATLMSQNYTASQQDAIVRLTDAAHHAEVSVVPNVGNNALDMRLNGKPVFWSPAATLAEAIAKPAMAGNPLLAPWANRLDHEGFWANNKHYRLNPDLKNYRPDGNQKPIHGLLLYSSLWRVKALGADDASAWVTSRLEFYRYPDLMAQFPFAHVIEMTYRLRDGVLQVETAIENLSTEPMPLAIGFHPYFALPDSHRDAWRVHVAAREHVLLSDVLIPTGECKPMELSDPVSLASTKLDDVFTNLVRGADGNAEFWVDDGQRRITVVYGPQYKVAVVYAPPGRDFICFEPMTAVTDAMNLAHDGKYPELDSIAPGATWRGSYWIKTTGY